MLVQFVVQTNMLANMEFEFECFFFYDSNVKIDEFRMFFIANEWTFTHVGQGNKLSKQPDQHVSLICWTCFTVCAGLKSDNYSIIRVKIIFQS